eukprot:scaffold1172_cov115-Cylindrotheca_fusiformis.AAC.4
MQEASMHRAGGNLKKWERPAAWSGTVLGQHSGPESRPSKKSFRPSNWTERRFTPSRVYYQLDYSGR